MAIICMHACLVFEKDNAKAFDSYVERKSSLPVFDEKCLKIDDLPELGQKNAQT